jgi:hypothetical protein
LATAVNVFKYSLFSRFSCIDIRKINTALAIGAAAFFGGNATIYHAAHIKQSCNKKYQYNYDLKIHTANLNKNIAFKVFSQG